MAVLQWLGVADLVSHMGASHMISNTYEHLIESPAA